MKDNEFKIVCPYCGTTHSAEVLSDLYGTQDCETYCETCGPEVHGSIEISCSVCKKLVYKKEY